MPTKRPPLPPGWNVAPDGTLYNDDLVPGKMMPDGTVQAQINSGGFAGTQGREYDPTKDGGTKFNLKGQHLTDTGNEREIAWSLQDPSSANYNNYNYRQDPLAAERDVNRDRWLEKHVQDREAVQANLANANQSRALQQQGYGGYASMLAGGGPSLANSAMQRGVEAGGAAGLMGGASAGGQRNALMMGGNAAVGGAGAGLSQRMNEQSMASQGAMNAGASIYGGDISAAQQQAQLVGQQRGLNDAASRLYGSQAIDVRNAQMNAGNTRQNDENTFRGIGYAHNNQNAAWRDQKDKDTLNTAMQAASTAAMVMSDERSKENVGDGGGATREMLDKLSPKTFWYKEGLGQAKGERLGIMAQDLESSKLGKSAIVEKDGYKQIDIGSGLGLAMAALADTNRRLKSLEGKK